MPLDVVRLHLALFVHVHLIFLHGLAFVVDRSLRRIVIEEAHERTVADKRNDAVASYWQTLSPPIQAMTKKMAMRR